MEPRARGDEYSLEYLIYEQKQGIVHEKAEWTPDEEIIGAEAI
jgi:hypothetical protein